MLPCSLLMSSCSFPNSAAAPAKYTLSLHDALPIWPGRGQVGRLHLADGIVFLAKLRLGLAEANSPDGRGAQAILAAGGAYHGILVHRRARETVLTITSLPMVDRDVIVSKVSRARRW